jgi:hypothetical protein
LLASRVRKLFLGREGLMGQLFATGRLTSRRKKDLNDTVGIGNVGLFWH